MQVFLCFQDDEETGCKFFRMRRRSKWNVLRMWGLRRSRRRKRRRRKRRRRRGTICGKNLYGTV
jgi:hypothetical protein